MNKEEPQNIDELVMQEINRMSVLDKYMRQEINRALGKIRAEIKQEYQIECEHPYGQGLKRAIEIIDKYTAGSEE